MTAEQAEALPAGAKILYWDGRIATVTIPASVPPVGEVAITFDAETQNPLHLEQGLHEGRAVMRLSVNLVAGGKYVRAGDELPPDFVLPPHLDRFAVYDDGPPQTPQGAARLYGAGGSLAKPATDYPEGEEEFMPRPKPTRGMKMGEEIRRAHQEERKRRL